MLFVFIKSESFPALVPGKGFCNIIGVFSAVVSVLSCQTTSQHGQLFNWDSRPLGDPCCSRGADVSSARPFTLSFILAAKPNCIYYQQLC